MAAPVIIPELQFIDADGHPYAGGSLATYVVGTSTPKATWVDPDGTALQTNPAILDAAGRCLLWGDGLYRLVLRAADGTLVWDQPATTIVSAAMAPVIAAPTIADAVHLLGIDDLIAAEAAARSAADSAEQTARIAAVGTEADTRASGDAYLQGQIDAINATLAGMGGGSVPLIQGASDISDSSGHKTVTYPTPYSAQPTVVVSVAGGGYGAECIVVNSNTNTHFDVWFAFPAPGSPTPVGPIQFEWIATGPG
jgi:hypothetical protein